MYLTGFADEASQDLTLQIKATKELGWHFIESRNINNVNLHNLEDSDFEKVVNQLNENGIKINCFGSAIGNWAKKINVEDDPSFAEAQRAVKRMKVLGTKLIRIMSYALIPDLDAKDQMIDKRIERLKRIVNLFLENDLTPVHENCMNYGGMGAKFTLELIEKIPGLKLVFDTGNPVFSKDQSKPKPFPYQSSWDFYSQVKNHIAYVHIKDGYMDPKTDKVIYTFPGEGKGDVKRIVKDLLDDGYDGGFSMEPHMASVFHDKNAKNENDGYPNYITYGKKFESIIRECGYEHKLKEKNQCLVK